MGALGALKTGRSDGAYGGAGRAAMDVLSALGPVGMLAGKLFGDVLMEASPLPLRGPKGGGGAVLEDVSLGAYEGSGVLENDGDTLALMAACGAVGGGRGRGAGPWGGDLAGPAGADGADGGGP